MPNREFLDKFSKIVSKKWEEESRKAFHADRDILSLKELTIEIIGDLTEDLFKEEEIKMIKKSLRDQETILRTRSKFINKYCKHRIDKRIYDLLDNGYKLSMALMKQLPMLVWDDIIIENYKEILNNNGILDLVNIRKDVSRKCGIVLNNFIKQKEAMGLGLELQIN